MSTKTNFKRIALVAVASLGLGVLTSVPSQAVISSGAVTVTNGSSTTAAYGDTVTVGTPATINVKGFADAAYDSITVTLGSGVTKPSAAGSTAFTMYWADTTGATTNTLVTRGVLPSTYASSAMRPVVYDTVSAGTVVQVMKGSTTTVDTGVANAFVGATFGVFVDHASTKVAGTYTGEVVVKFYESGALVTSKTLVKEFSIVVTAVASATLVADASQSTAVLSGGTTAASRSDSPDSTTVSLAATAGTQGAVVRVWLKNYAGNAAQESLTVTTDRGNVAALAGGSSGTQGKSLVMVYNTATDLANGYKDIGIYGDGTAGAATITIKSTSVTFANKSVTFYATSVASIAKPTVLTTVIGASASSTNLLAVAKDSNGNIAGSSVTLYAYSSDTTIVSDNGSSCTFNATLAGHVCSVTGVKAGSATFIVRDQSTVALSTVSSVASDAIRVSVASPATVKIAFDKATYAPSEKATITVSVLDAAGLSVAANTFSNAFATGGITSNVSFGSGSDTLTNVSVTTATDVTESIVTPVKTYTVYMPASGGTVTLTAKGGASLAAAGQVTVTATATITDNAAAALAAVTALATTVASLRTLITTLTNLVLKIQKKVKA